MRGAMPKRCRFPVETKALMLSAAMYDNLASELVEARAEAIRHRMPSMPPGAASRRTRQGPPMPSAKRRTRLHVRAGVAGGVRQACVLSQIEI